jgi:hypothetical protein
VRNPAVIADIKEPNSPIFSKTRTRTRTSSIIADANSVHPGLRLPTDHPLCHQLERGSNEDLQETGWRPLPPSPIHGQDRRHYRYTNRFIASNTILNDLQAQVLQGSFPQSLPSKLVCRPGSSRRKNPLAEYGRLTPRFAVLQCERTSPNTGAPSLIFLGRQAHPCSPPPCKLGNTWLPTLKNS